MVWLNGTISKRKRTCDRCCRGRGLNCLDVGVIRFHVLLKGHLIQIINAAYAASEFTGVLFGIVSLQRIHVGEEFLANLAAITILFAARVEMRLELLQIGRLEVA